MVQLAILVFAAAFTAAPLYFLRHKARGTSLYLKVLTVAFCAVGFLRLFLSDAFVLVVNGGWVHSGYLDKPDYLQSFLRLGYYAGYSVLPMAVFFKTRLFRNLASYVFLPASLLSAVFVDRYMEYFFMPEALGYKIAPNLHYWIFMLELALAIAIPVLLQISEKHVFNVKSVREWLTFFVCAPFVFIVTMPAYFIQSVFGADQLYPALMSKYHITCMVVLLFVTLALYYLFRFRPYCDRYAICVFLALALFYNYNTCFLLGMTLKRLPIQLCNLAAYLLLPAMIFKMKRLFQFCFIANMFGTVFAILLADFSQGYFAFWNVHFLLEHSLVLMVPALAMGLRIMPRLTKKSLKYFFIGFTVYFIFCFIMGTVINGYAETQTDRVNYFYMFDLDLAFEYFPFLTRAGDLCITIGIFEIYPIVIGIVYVGYSALCLLFCLLIRLFYRLEDDHLTLRAASIELYEKVTKKKSHRKKEFID